MKTKPFLTNDDARRIAAAAEAEATGNQWAVTIAIADDGGHLLWLQRLDGAAPISAQIAPAKARTAHWLPVASASAAAAMRRASSFVRNGLVFMPARYRSARPRGQAAWGHRAPAAGNLECGMQSKRLSFFHI
jgi:uncharacterized protein GlcG (DUF336 family)